MPERQQSYIAIDLNNAEKLTSILGVEGAHLFDALLQGFSIDEHRKEDELCNILLMRC